MNRPTQDSVRTQHPRRQIRPPPLLTGPKSEGMANTPPETIIRDSSNVFQDEPMGPLCAAGPQHPSHPTGAALPQHRAEAPGPRHLRARVQWAAGGWWAGLPGWAVARVGV